MTSKNLFIRRLKQELEQRIWLPVIFFILSFLAMEMNLISYFDRISEKLDFTKRATDYVMNTFFSVSDSGFVIFTIIVAVISALSGFSYMHSSKKLDVYHSMPIKREKLFGQQYIYGILYYVIPFAIHVILCLVICAGNGLGGFKIYGQALGFVLVNLLVYLAVYAVTVLAVTLTGNIVISVLGSVVLLLYSYILALLKYELMERFFETYYYFYNAEYMGGIWAFSPIHLVIQMCDAMNDAEALNYTGYFGYYGKFILMIIVYTIAALWLYQKRHTESAGKSMAFALSEPFVKTLVVFPASFGCGYIICGIASNSNSFGWYLFGCVFGFAIICPLMEIIFRKDVKAVFKRPLQIAFNGALVLIVVFLFRLDVFGYDTYIPAEDKVESYAVYFNEINNPMNYGTWELLEDMKITDNESTRRLLEHAAEVTRPLRKGDIEELNDGSKYTGLAVKYNLKNGKSVYRSYMINIGDAQIMQYVADTYNDRKFKESAYPILAEDYEKTYNGIQLQYGYYSESIQLGEKEMQEFLEVYTKELMNFTFDEMQSDYPIATLAFTIPYREGDEDYPVVVREETLTNTTVSAEMVKVYGDGVDFEFYDTDSGYRIYPAFTETLALLTSYGANPVNEIEVENIINIQIEDYSREVNDHDGVLSKLIEVEFNPEKDGEEAMQQILDSIVADRFIEGIDAYSKAEENISVRIDHFYEGRERSNHFTFRKGMMPDCVAEALQEAAKNLSE